ncbi:MAG: rRNA methyltransferase, partial [Proteobacteria bacterium]|nr:rRNA methyltransferase [Pseudomonadota bacterium]
MTPPDAAGLPARAAALDLLAAALGGRAGLDEGLNHAALAALPPRDRAFARALVMAALRHLGPIDMALQSRLKKPPPERVVNVLRLGLAQLFVLKTPPHAAVGSTVDLVARQKGGQQFKGLVNAVLRGLTREPPALDDPDLLAPAWLYARWRAAYGADEARAIAAAIAEEP